MDRLFGCIAVACRRHIMENDFLDQRRLEQIYFDPVTAFASRPLVCISTEL
jgi:hypothetical protein